MDLYIWWLTVNPLSHHKYLCTKHIDPYISARKWKHDASFFFFLSTDGLWFMNLCFHMRSSSGWTRKSTCSWQEKLILNGSSFSTFGTEYKNTLLFYLLKNKLTKTFFISPLRIIAATCWLKPKYTLLGLTNIPMFIMNIIYRIPNIILAVLLSYKCRFLNGILAITKANHGSCVSLSCHHQHANHRCCFRTFILSVFNIS